MKTTRSLLIAAMLTAGLGAVPRVASAQTLPPSEWVIGPEQRIAMLTFEGRARAGVVASVVGALDELGADATFFFPGSWIAHHKNKVAAAARSGHLIGNRGYSSTPFTELSDEAIAASIVRAEEAIAAVASQPRPFLRPPKGRRDARVLGVAASLGYRSVRWTQHPGGGFAKKIARKVVRRAQAGTIISLDVWRKSHRKALPGIIQGLRDRGFALRTIAPLRRTHAVRWDVTLGSGSSGTEVAYLQRTLKSVSYPAGAADGTFGYETLQAVYAFEKVNGMTRDAIVTPADMTRIAVARRPRVPDREPAAFVDVDISRQVLFEVRDGRVIRTLPVSSGNEEYYEQDGQTYKAHTPRGDFIVERKIPGWRESDLGKLWYPSYFIGGYAIHGSESVPPYPASHGCVRIPMYVTKGFYDRNPVGMPVFVHD